MKRYIIRICQLLFGTSLIAILAVAISYAASGTFVTAASITNSLTDKTQQADNQANTAAQKQLFTEAIQTAADNYPRVQTGVSLIDLDANSHVDAGETVAFTAASTTKVLTAAAYMHLVETGNAGLTTTINGTPAQQLLQRMLNLSDNAAWSALNDYVGHDNLQQYANEHDLSSYNVENNTITAHDQAQLLAKLYKNQLINSAHTKLLLSYMQNTNNEDLIPAAVPSGATVYHKYGYLNGELHDSAIISYKGHHFILVIFTKNNAGTLDDYNERVTLFQAITEAAIRYSTS